MVCNSLPKTRIKINSQSQMKNPKKELLDWAIWFFLARLTLGSGLRSEGLSGEWVEEIGDKASSEVSSSRSTGDWNLLDDEEFSSSVFFIAIVITLFSIPDSSLTMGFESLQHQLLSFKINLYVNFLSFNSDSASLDCFNKYSTKSNSHWFLSSFNSIGNLPHDEKDPATDTEVVSDGSWGNTIKFSTVMSLQFPCVNLQLQLSSSVLQILQKSFPVK